MTQKLAKSAHSVQEALNKLQLECQVLELPSSTRTALDASSSIGCDIAQIVKSLIFKTSNSKQPVLVLASGPNQVNEKEIEEYLGEKIAKADANFVKDITGFAIGVILPIGHKNIINHIYIDKDLMNLDIVSVAAGTPKAVFCIKAKDLLAATKGKVISL